MNLSLEHIAIPATNPIALKKWYERVLGARPIWDNGQNPPVCLIELPGGVWLEIYGSDLPLAARDVTLAWTEFEVIETRLGVRVTRLA